MSIIDIQFDVATFGELFRTTVNRMRLPSATLDVWPELRGKPLQRIECVSCTADPSDGAGQVVLQVNLLFSYNEDIADIQAAGSLQEPAYLTFPVTLPVTVSVAVLPNDANNRPVPPQLRWSSVFGQLTPSNMSIRLPDALRVFSAAVDADAEVLAIRLATDPNDVIPGAIAHRLDGQDWAQFIPGPLFADMLVTQLRSAVDDAVRGDANLILDTAPSGQWWPTSMIDPEPHARSAATVAALHQCAFGIEIPIDLTLTMHFRPDGPSLTTIVRFSWDPDSTVCQIVGSLLMTPIGAFVIRDLVRSTVSERLLGRPSSTPSTFHERDRGEDWIEYEQSAVVDTPSPQFTVTNSRVSDDGLTSFGAIRIPPAPLGLRGGATPPTSGLDANCTARRVDVVFRPPTVSLEDIGMIGGSAPRLFYATVDPPGAWDVRVDTSPNLPDLVITFTEPAGGHLPAGTSTSAVLATDCGTRWADLGTIPVDHEPPTIFDTADMLSSCMAISDRWGMGVLNLHWLVDPPNERYGIDPVREWTIAFAQLPQQTPVQFYAVGPAGERLIGEVVGDRPVTVQVTTNADESIDIRSDEQVEGAPPAVSQRWIIPFAAVELESTPSALVAADGVVAIRDNQGAVLVLDRPSDGELVLAPIATDSAPLLVADALGRRDESGLGSWATTARLDRQVVAVAAGNTLLLGRRGPSVQA